MATRSGSTSATTSGPAPQTPIEAELRIYAELRDFLAPAQRSGRIVHRSREPASVKDVIESHGVPHTEVDVVLANGTSVDWGYRVVHGDRISVYPVFEAFDIGPLVRLRPRPLREPRFILDVHLGKLARRLRLLGFDASYSRGASDDELVKASRSERRILLTRDLGILKRKAVTHGSFVRSIDPRRQVREVVERFQLEDRIAPFTRCVACNGTLEAVAKDQIAHLLPPMTRQLYDDFRRCAACHKLYWRGAHHARLHRLVAEAIGSLGEAQAPVSAAPGHGRTRSHPGSAQGGRDTS
jgi:uncharacterized protein with PIN domain